MAIPKFDELFPIILEIFEDGKILKNAEIVDAVIQKLNLTEEEKQRLLPSGTQTVIYNRADWAAYYLRRASLLKVEKRGQYQISEIGLEYIKENGYQILLNDLYQYESFREFQNKSKITKNGENLQPKKADTILDQNQEEEQQTPEEQIDEAIKALNQQLADEIITTIMDLPWQFFEKLVLDLLIAMGYGGKDKRNSKLTPLSNDEGIDGLIKEDELGLDHIYIQAKRWSNTVGRTEIQQFAGALSGFGARKGVFITTSKFSKGAEEFVSRQLQSKIVLISGEELARQIIAYGVGLNIENTYVMQKIDKDYFFYDG